MKKQDTYSILNNSRFYILSFSFLASVAIFSWLRLHIDSDQLLFIRLQQIFGFVCLLFWYAALIISPIGYVIGKNRMTHINFTRRAIGVSAFYYALLHAVIALWGQLGGPGEITRLPSLFQWSLYGGFVALFVLFLMAITSFDRVITFMTFRRWKWLHRLVYAAGVIVILHIWSIGTHLAYSGVQIAALIMLATLAGLELFRIIKTLNKKYFALGRAELFGIFLTCWAIVITIIICIPAFVKNYHSSHLDHATTHQESHKK